MIPEYSATVMASYKKNENWRLQLAQAIKDPLELLSILDLACHPELILAAKQAARLFPLKVSRSFVNRMQVGNPNDPLLLQVLPMQYELEQHPGYVSDPVADLDSNKSLGLIQKYHGRALMITTSNCAVHCRYCFRREYPYDDAATVKDQWQSALDYLMKSPSIDEIILSGGDPLSLSDRRLTQLVKQLADIPHLKRLRFHSRLPIMIPSRINQALLHCLTSTRLKPVMVIHVNHAQEIDSEVHQAMTLLKQHHIPLFNQSVLLNKINDSSESLAELSLKLFDSGVIPYYLHMLDQANGTAHYAVSDQQAKQIMVNLNKQLPGYLIPKLVREVAGEPAKVPLLP